MASSSENRQNSAIKGGTGVTKTPANSDPVPESSRLHDTTTGFHQMDSAAPKNEMKTTGKVGDGSIGMFVQDAFGSITGSGRKPTGGT
ncbi:hypothetical protein RUND412_006752 [Rhizina undulata]